MLHTLDAPAVRTWCQLALRALGQAREEIDALNVYPVPDGDTGTNLYLTVESAAAEVESRFADPAADPAPGLADTARAMARGALVGARGNSGVILAQWLRGTAETLAEGGGADQLRAALQRAADSAYQAVAEPVEGTLLTVARVAAREAVRAGDGLAQVADTAYRAARDALRHTPEQLAVLAENGVVDAGGRGLVAVLGALADAVAGQQPMGPVALRGDVREVESCAVHLRPPGPGHPAFEVIYLLDAPDEALPALRERLGGLGDSLVVGGGDGLWNVHVHVDDAGAAVEAGVEAGRPHQIRITHFAEAAARAGSAAERGERRERARAVLCVVSGGGWPSCASRPAPSPCTPTRTARRPVPNSRLPCAARPPARWSCCSTTPNCAPPPGPPPTSCARRACGSPCCRPARRCRAWRRSRCTRAAAASTRTWSP